MVGTIYKCNLQLYQNEPGGEHALCMVKMHAKTATAMVTNQPFQFTAVTTYAGMKACT